VGNQIRRVRKESSMASEAERATSGPGLTEAQRVVKERLAIFMLLIVDALAQEIYGEYRISGGWVHEVSDVLFLYDAYNTFSVL
jgi:hypothetical protein